MTISDEKTGVSVGKIQSYINLLLHFKGYDQPFWANGSIRGLVSKALEEK